MQPQPGTPDVPGCVCVVDDDTALRHAMVDLLEAEGYAALAFDTGASLLASPRLVDIDVAVIDIRLAGMDGFAVKRALDARGMAIPVIFVSGEVDLQLEHCAGAHGAVCLLRKPLDLELLSRSLLVALRRRRARP